MTFMACYSAASGDDCDAKPYKAKLWLPCAVSAGADGSSVIVSLPSPPQAGTLAALRYAWCVSCLE